MWLALVLSSVVLQTAPPKQAKVPPAPSAYDTAKLFFLAGDLAKAQQWARRGLKQEPKTCGPLNIALAEYNFLANHIDEFTLEQAKTFLELDRKISPTVRGRVTEKAFFRYVSQPLEQARGWADGNRNGALQLVARVLAVDPKNPGALELQSRLNKLGNQRDGGP